jgi:hypothetical protein
MLPARRFVIRNAEVRGMRSLMQEPLCYTLTEASRMLSISLRTLQRRIASGDVAVVYIFGMPRIARAELKQLLSCAA